MALPLLMLPRQPPDPYRPGVPRQPKNFRIDSVSVEHLEPEGYLSTGSDTAVPSRFEAHFVLGIPEASVTIEVFISTDLRPVVLDLSIRSKVRTPITTSTLRQVLVDQLLNAALAEATVPATVRDDWLASLPASVQPQSRRIDPKEAPASSKDHRPSGRAGSDALMAAQIYSEAVAAGNRAPAVAVANAMNRSRSQVARYIKRAREQGLLAPLDPSDTT
jgi:hypothetical protein